MVSCQASSKSIAFNSTGGCGFSRRGDMLDDEQEICKLRSRKEVSESPAVLEKLESERLQPSGDDEGEVK